MKLRASCLLVALAAFAACAHTPSRPPARVVGDAKSAARSTNAFGLDVYHRVVSPKKNLLISPISIATALAMTFYGARGETAAELGKALYVDGDRTTAVNAWGAFARDVTKPSEARTLRIVNRLFGEATYEFQDEFLKRSETVFDARLEPAHFRDDPDGERAKINAWVAEKTEQRIHDLLPQGSIKTDTSLVLVNAVYFLGKWAQSFAHEATRPKPFRTLDGTKEVPTMAKDSYESFAAAHDAKMVALPYRGGDLAMYIALPDADGGLADLERSLDAASLEAWFDSMKEARVDITLPKFTIDPTAPIALSPVLGSLGVRRAFDEARADFSGIGGKPCPTETCLFISEVFHKAFVKVDEDGTEAAAATAVVMSASVTSVAPEPPPPVPFHVDHPFLFFIVHVPTKAVLFMGRVVDPVAK